MNRDSFAGLHSLRAFSLNALVGREILMRFDETEYEIIWLAPCRDTDQPFLVHIQ